MKTSSFLFNGYIYPKETTSTSDTTYISVRIPDLSEEMIRNKTPFKALLQCVCSTNNYYLSSDSETAFNKVSFELNGVARDSDSEVRVYPYNKLYEEAYGEAIPSVTYSNGGLYLVEYMNKRFTILPISNLADIARNSENEYVFPFDIHIDGVNRSLKQIAELVDTLSDLGSAALTVDENGNIIGIADIQANGGEISLKELSQAVALLKSAQEEQLESIKNLEKLTETLKDALSKLQLDLDNVVTYTNGGDIIFTDSEAVEVSLRNFYESASSAIESYAGTITSHTEAIESLSDTVSTIGQTVSSMESTVEGYGESINELTSNFETLSTQLAELIKSLDLSKYLTLDEDGSVTIPNDVFFNGSTLPEDYQEDVQSLIQVITLIDSNMSTIQETVAEIEDTVSSLATASVCTTVYGKNPVVTDSTDASLLYAKFNGYTVQNSIPTPDAPIDIKGLGDSGVIEVKTKNEDETEETTASIPITSPLYAGDYMEVYADGSGKIVRTNAKIDSYAGEEITTDYVSTTGELREGATVLYKLAAPTEELLTPEQVAEFKKLYTFKSITNFFCDGEIAARYYCNTDGGDTVSRLQKTVDELKGGRLYIGTAITGTSTTDTVFSNSGIPYAYAGDIYINNSNDRYKLIQAGENALMVKEDYSMYICTNSGDSSNATWVYKGDVNRKVASSIIFSYQVDYYEIYDADFHIPLVSLENKNDDHCDIAYAQQLHYNPYYQELNSNLSGYAGSAKSMYRKYLDRTSTDDLNELPNLYAEYNWIYGAYGNSCLNKPSGVDAFSLEQQKIGAGTITNPRTGVKQEQYNILQKITSINGVFYRQYDYSTSTWSDWFSDGPEFENLSHLEGSNTTASGNSSHAEGQNTVASGQYSHAEGFETKASLYSAHAEGWITAASGAYSHAEGQNTVASGAASHASGVYTITHCGAAMAIGSYNNDQYSGDVTDPTNYISSFAGTSNHYNAFIIGNGYSGHNSNAFRVEYNGSVYGQAAYNSSGADYAEFLCEWADKNVDDEDRVGYFVTIKDNKLYKANDGDYIAGITSGNPSVVGNSDETYFWKYERDEFNRFIYVEEPVLDEEGNEVTDDEGNVFTHTVRKLSDDYDPEQKYIPRTNRPEWDYVGMKGVIPVRDDGTFIVNGYCKCGKDGVATFAESKDTFTYFVKERISDEVVSVII